jgi:hypothetical protein
MAKTTFSSGVIVTSQWLNGAQQIYFDGQDLDWHYNPLGLSSLVTTGPDGLDSRYITLGTEQPYLDSNGEYISGVAISGNKVVSGAWNFGYDPAITGNPVNNRNNAPRSYVSNQKYNFAGGISSPTPAQKIQSLNAADLITKEMLVEQLEYLKDVLVIDNGVYYSSAQPSCNNYTAPGGSSQVCPN